MKKSVKITVILLCVYLAQNCLLYPAQTVRATQTNYVALGDSITEGTGMTSVEDTFVCLFSETLQSQFPDLTTYNLGKEGDTVLKTLEKVQQEDTTKLLHNASYITVTTGGNDILAIAASAAKQVTGKNYKKASKIPNLAKNEATARLLLSYLQQKSVQQELDSFVKNFAANFHNLISTLKTKSPTATILVQTIYNPASGSSYETLSKCIDLVMDRINAVIREEVYEQDSDQLLLCDTYTLFQNQADRFVRIADDDIHPTAQGHEAIAEALASTLSQGSSATSITSSESETDAANAALTPALSDNATATDSARQKTGKIRFLTWVGSSFVCGLLALMLYKIVRLHST